MKITLCLTRRKLQVFTWWTHGNGNFQWPAGAAVARSDYGANGGDRVIEPSDMHLWSAGNCYNDDCEPPSIPTDATLASIKQKADTFGATGIDYPMSTRSLACVKHGLSYTYLLGEKGVAVDMYTTGLSMGDNENQYIGFNADIGRWTQNPPAQDRKGCDNYNSFGSAHAAGFNMAFCDGSARKMSYTINPTIHKQLGNRADGQPTQLQELESN